MEFIFCSIEEALSNDDKKKEQFEKEAENRERDRLSTLKERDDLRAERRRVEARRSQLERKLEDTEGTLREAKAETKQSLREEAMRNLVGELKQTFPSSVYGMVTDLADPTSDRYKLAMSVTMGRDLDSVIVDTPETAMKCIQLVKERRIPPMTFLPADTIRVPEINPALRALGGTSKLAIDCLRIKDERSVRAFNAICGNALLCDSVDEARQLAYNGETRHKVIALDGTAFLRNGLITGGMTTAMEDRAKKWDQEKVVKLKEERSNVASELSLLPQLRDITQKLQAAEAKVTRLENEKTYASAEFKSLQEKIKESKQNIVSLQKGKDTKIPQAKALESKMMERKGKMRALRAKMDHIAENLFKEFVKKIGVSSIKEYEEMHLRQAEKLSERKAAIISQIARVQNQIEYESAADPKTEVEKASRDLKSLRQSLESLENEASDLDSSNSKAKAELEAFERENEDSRATLLAMDAKVKELRENVRKAIDEVASRKRTISSLMSKVEQLKISQADVLESAELENITLPTKDDKRTTKRSRSGDSPVEKKWGGQSPQ